MNSLTSRSASSPATIAARRPDPSILSMPPLAAECRTSATENGLPILRQALPVLARNEIHSRMSAIERSLSAAASEAEILAAIGMVSSMPRRSGDSLAADLLVEAWVSTLLDTKMIGVIPGWAISEAARAFVSGMAGAKWMPSVGEFVAEAKRRMAPVRRSLVDFRQILDAPVAEQPSEADLAARRERVASLLEGFLAPAAPPAPARHPPDGWEERRAAVFEHLTPGNAQETDEIAPLIDQ